MDQGEAFSEAVFIFEGGEITEEMHFADFEACLAGDAKLEAFAASVVSGMYVVIGTGLAIRGIVCFDLAIDENGVADSAFSVPLRHLVSVAGAGPDLGCGPVRLACRSQCPVSWHAHNLWEPEGEGDANPLAQAQSTVWVNRLGYNQQTVCSTGSSLDFGVLDQTGDTASGVSSGGLEDLEEVEGRVVNGDAEASPPPNGTSTANGTSPPENVPDDDPFKRHSRSMLQRKIERTFGEDGTVSLQKLLVQHNEQIDALTSKARGDLEQQQQVYLDQIRGCRDEIQKLKSELRHEQTRNQRLQQLLRGETG
jgi:hypothetical protein